MSNTFDVLLNSSAFAPEFGDPVSRAEIRLDEYEKSVMLTRAQLARVMALYNGAYGESFEQTEELTDYLSSLVRQATLTPEQEGAPHIVTGSYIFKLPAGLLYRTYESCVLTDATAFACDGGSRTALVVPVTQDEFWRTKRNPFKGPNGNKVLRLAYSVVSQSGVDSFTSDTSKVDQYSELVSKYPVTSYTVRYVKRPRPIILVDLPDGLSIDGETSASECELNPQIHQSIVEDAVVLALRTRQVPNTTSNNNNS